MDGSVQKSVLFVRAGGLVKLQAVMVLSRFPFWCAESRICDNSYGCLLQLFDDGIDDVEGWVRVGEDGSGGWTWLRSAKNDAGSARLLMSRNRPEILWPENG